MPVVEKVEPYIFDSDFTMNDINEYLCNNLTQLAFITSPYSRFFEMNGELKTIPVNMAEYQLDCDVFTMDK